MSAQTLYDKIWSSHVVAEYEDGASLLYIDRHMLHDVSSAQAFAELRRKGLQPRRRGTHLAVADHAVPTRHRDRPFADGQAARQVALLGENCQVAGVNYIPITDRRHGIVHVIGPEQGFTLPGTTLVCGDSHTSTHGAFGALAFGIGTSESACVLATQTVRQRRSKTLAVRIVGDLPPGVAAKDLALHVVGSLGASGAQGYAVEYLGNAVSALSMAERMTLCNMTIEAGARSGMVAPDDTTFAFLEGRSFAPRGERWLQAVDYWTRLRSDAGAAFDRQLEIRADALAPQVTWGTSPDQVVAVTGRVPDPAQQADEAAARKCANALDYMGLKPGTAMEDIPVDFVFIGSCTNSRIEDLRAAAAVLRGRRVAAHVRGIVVPGSGLVKAQAEAEGLAEVFLAAGLEWRDAGCSLCVAINDDRLAPGERCASTSNRNFEGRQGIGARTHLVSPAMAAAAAVAGHFTDVRSLMARG